MVEDSGFVEPPPGTPTFFPALLSHIRLASPSLPLDSVVLQSILICTIAGDKHLILRTREEDVSLVTKLASSVLTSVFSYPTHRLKVRIPSSNQSHPQSTTAFLRSMFLPSNLGGHHSISGTSSPSLKTKPRRTKSSFLARSSSSPSALVDLPISNTFDLPASHASPPTSTCTMSPNDDKSKSPKMEPMRTNTDPSPLTFRIGLGLTVPPSPLFPKSEANLVLPKALVVSGLELTSGATQRALVRVLTEKRVILEGGGFSENEKTGSGCGTGTKANRDDREFVEDGVWNLPDGFIMVFVCSFDPRERPKIHKSLLDKFAMSSTINLLPSLRQAIRSSNFHRSASSVSLTTFPATPAHPLVSPNAQTPTLPATFLPHLRRLCEQAHIASDLALYTTDLFAAARHHPEFDGTLLTARARKDVDGLVKAGRVVGGDLTGVEVVKAMADIRAEEESEGGERSYEQVACDSPSVERAPSFASTSCREEVLDVSEADIARIVPRVISHRLRVRDGPEDEILASVVYSAVKGSRGSGENRQTEGVGEERSTVKDILIKILSEV